MTARSLSGKSWLLPCFCVLQQEFLPGAWAAGDEVFRRFRRDRALAAGLSPAGRLL